MLADDMSTPETDEVMLQRIMQLYERLDRHNYKEIYGLYASDVYFEDPAHAVQGISALMRYFDTLFTHVEECRFGFQSSHTDGENLFLTWTMMLHHARLNSGKPIYVDGASLMKIRQGRIYYHRDYFDLGAMLYENLPVLGGLIALIKRKLAG